MAEIKFKTLDEQIEETKNELEFKIGRFQYYRGKANSTKTRVNLLRQRLINLEELKKNEKRVNN